MTTEITMPKLSDTMTEGVFGEWKKSVGEQVAKGDIIAEVETDKATMELEAFASGVLVEQRVGAGETVAVGAVIGIIGDAEQAAKEKAPAKAEPAAPVEAKKVEPETEPAAPVEKKTIEPADAEPAPSPEAGPPASAEEGLPPDDQQTAEFRLPEPGPENDLREETGKMESTPEQDADKPGPAVEKEASSEKSAPVVRRRAQELGIDLATVHGSGPGGRILLDDLKGAETASPAPAEDRQTTEGEGQKRPDDTHRVGEVYALNRMQVAVSRTVSESWRTIPHFFVTQDIHINRAEQIRRELKMQGVRVSLTEIIIKAAALALLKFPKVNSSLKDEGIISHQEINIGLMAKVTGGLLVPVVKGCQALSLREISDKTRKLLERVRNGTITQPEISGGTFSISNLGMYDVSEFTAIILPPQVAILAVGTVRDVLKGGGAGWPSVERYMKVTLSADHRVLDGVDAADFLKELKRILENPVQLLL